MIVYIGMLIVTILLLYFAEKNSNKKIQIFLYCLAVLPFIVISAIRYNLGTDYSYRYVPDYNTIANGGDVKNLEIGFKGLIKFCLLFTKDPQLLFVITSIIINVLIFYVIYKKSTNIIFSVIILFFNGFFFSSLNIVRQCMASSIIFIGYLFLVKEDNVKKNNILYIICVCIAFLIHKSSIITAVFLFYTRRNIMNWKWVIPCSIIMLLLGEKLLVLFKVLLQNTQYSVYFLDKFLKSDVSIVYLIENIIVYTFMNIKYYMDKKNNKTNKEEILFLNIEGLCLIITVLAKCHVEFDRLSQYCLNFQLLSIPYFINKIKLDDIAEKIYNPPKYIGMIVVSIVMFMAIFTKTNILNNNGEVVPYKTVFNKNYEIR